MPTKDELLAQLKSEHNIDVEALQAAASKGPDMSALTAALTEALKPAETVKLTRGEDDEVSLTDIVGAVAELATTNSGLASDVVSLKRKDAEREVDGYVEKGLVLPKQRDAFIDMALTNREQLEVLLPDEPVVELSRQEGVTPPDDSSHRKNIDAEILRLTTADHTSRYFPASA